MIATKKHVLGLIITFLSVSSLAQDLEFTIQKTFKNNLNHFHIISTVNRFNIPQQSLGITFCENQSLPYKEFIQRVHLLADVSTTNQLKPQSQKVLSDFSCIPAVNPIVNMEFSKGENQPFYYNKRNIYSSLWAFATLNYLYADLVGIMDANMLAQYNEGVVNGTKITPQFLTVAAGFMQIPIANVFLPHLIKNEKTLRWVQIASGTIMTLVQAGTLFVGKPTSYYVLFSTLEIAATTYITIDAIKWKAKTHKKIKM